MNADETESMKARAERLKELASNREGTGISENLLDAYNSFCYRHGPEICQDILTLLAENERLKALWQPISEQCAKELKMYTMPSLLDCPDDIGETKNGAFRLAHLVVQWDMALKRAAKAEAELAKVQALAEGMAISLDYHDTKDEALLRYRAHYAKPELLPPMTPDARD